MNKRMLVITVLLLSAVAGCGQTINKNDAGAALQQGSGGSKIEITDFANRKVAFDHVPQSIVALSNGDMDIVYALGGSLVGRPASQGPVPVKEAEKVEQIGSTHEIDLEKIAFLHPDVVLGNSQMNLKDVPAVEGIGSKLVLTNANSIADIKRQIQLFGNFLQKQDKASELVKRIDEKLQEAEAHRENGVKPRVLMVYGAPGTYMAALNNSLSGDVLTAAGGENIAADYPGLQNYPQYAQLNTEKIIKSDPQLILLMTHGDAGKVKEGFIKEMQQNEAWNSLDAVRNNRIEVLPADLFGTNPGSRVVEAIELMESLLQAAKG